MVDTLKRISYQTDTRQTPDISLIFSYDRQLHCIPCGCNASPSRHVRHKLLPEWPVWCIPRGCKIYSCFCNNGDEFHNDVDLWGRVYGHIWSWCGWHHLPDGAIPTPYLVDRVRPYSYYPPFLCFEFPFLFSTIFPTAPKTWTLYFIAIILAIALPREYYVMCSCLTIAITWLSEI